MTTDKLDNDLLQSVLDGFGKQAFVPMPGGQAEPVAGASPATAAMGAPMGSPPGGGMPQQGGGMPQQGGGMPPQGGMPPGAPPQGGGMPPELMQMMQDPMIQQALNQAGVMISPDGSAIDQQTGQPIPPEELMAAIQELMGGQGGGMPPGGAPAEGVPPAAPAPAEEEDPTLTLLEEIRDALVDMSGKMDSLGKPEKSEKPEGGSTEGGVSDLGQVTVELGRTNDMLQQLLSGGGM